MARKTQQISVTVDTRVLADEVRRHHLGHALDAFEREHGAINSLELTEARAKLRRKPSRRRAA